MRMSGSRLIVTVKITVLILGAITVGLGVHSHYHSSWLTHNIPRQNLNISEEEAQEMDYNQTALKPSQICQLHNLLDSWGWAPSDMIRCPDMTLEQYFVIIVVFSFCFSICFGMLLWSRMVNLDMHCWLVAEVCYHAPFSVLLFVAGVAYIYSANKIVDFVKPEHADEEFMDSLLTHQKLTAGALAVVQSFLYGVLTGLIGYRLQY